ncbi:hypothetical protein CLONEX_03687 [[Clostridium] nexile DSM 1787]|nr:hypothetical protein CLONEX_03687 [[Clostridium] nexile DSM 1787]
MWEDGNCISVLFEVTQSIGIMQSRFLIRDLKWIYCRNIF